MCSPNGLFDVSASSRALRGAVAAALALAALNGTATAADPAFADGTNPFLLSPSEPVSPIISTKGVKGVYGEDNRLELAAVKSAPVLAAARAVPALVRTDQLGRRGQTYELLDLPRFTEDPGSGQPLCDDERFRGQPAASFCSGFLVASDRVATAAHCLKGKVDRSLLAAGESCGHISFVFDYQLGADGSFANRFTPAQVRRCGQVQHIDNSPDTRTDWAIVSLDEPVLDRVPVELRRDSPPMAGAGVTVIGYPSGLPAKVTGGGAIHDASNPVFFLTDLDTYGGNSGSPVFNTKSLLGGGAVVEGILVRGGKDFEVDSARGCARTVVCPGGREGVRLCRGEDVMRIEPVAKLVQVRRSDPRQRPEVVTGVVSVLDQLLRDAGHLQLEAPRQVLREGQDLVLTIQVPREGYLNVIAVSPSGVATVLYPNGIARGNRVSTGAVRVPDSDSWVLTTPAESGQWRLVGLFSEQPLNLFDLADARDRLVDFAPLRDAVAAFVAEQGRAKPLYAGEARVDVGAAGLVAR